MRIDTLNRRILRIAMPSILSNITVPLLGLVDTAIAGHLGRPSYIGAIAVGGVIFNIVYWLFCFLRWGTSGLTAQALGAANKREITLTLYRSMLIALIVGVGLIAAQHPIIQTARWLMDMTQEVAQYTTTYFSICIWGAIAVQLLYALNGWFIGMQNSRIPMIAAIVQNAVNIPLSLLLVFGLGMQIEGIALGTVIAQYIGLAVALWLLWRNYRHSLNRAQWGEILNRTALGRFLTVNRDIMLRMVCLLSVTLWFTRSGASQGELTLAANTILFQLFYLFSFFFDGFANAAEAMCGRAWGAKNPEEFVATIKRVMLWGAGLVFLFSATYLLFEEWIVALLSDQEAVVAVTHRYYDWVLLIPISGMLTFVFDGVLIGATATKPLLLSMAVGTALFFLTYLLAFPLWANDGLWLSFILYLAGRGLTQIFIIRSVIKPICRP